MKKLLLISTMLAGCASPHLISEKETAWIAAGSVLNPSIYYCERITVKGVLLPICTEATMISDWVRLEKFKSQDPSHK